ncbi:MAG: sulfite exporter TauE/SafE family protein [Alphaproteobacteria bacterium]|nr:sulfite exporter TauE/SafE family protein [Alphaproteobacteria bacterium]
MDFTLYWFMFPVAVVVATTAMLSGIGGAALFTPIFLLVFPALGPEYPLPSATAAFGAALLTQTFGFASGLVGYWRKRLIDLGCALPFIAVAVPFAVAGALASHLADEVALKATYGVLMAAGAWVMLRRGRDAGSPDAAAGLDGDAEVVPAAGATMRTVIDRAGRSYSFAAPRQSAGGVVTSLGAFFTGLVSTGIGEVIMPQLVKRNRVPVAVAAATSVAVVISTTAAASATQVWSLMSAGGLNAVPWNLVCYTVPGVLIGGQLGPFLQGRLSQGAMVRAIGVLFCVIAIAMMWIAARDWRLSP